MTEFETTFEVRATPAETWTALEDLRADRVDLTVDPDRWWLPGFESTGREVAHDPERSLTVTKDQWPCEGTSIVITFEHVPSGTRITVIQSGFDETFVAASGEGFWIVCEQIAADLRLFFETGVLGGRHSRPWTALGCEVDATPVGLEVARVWDGSWAERVGLGRGDVLLTLAGAPLTSVRDLVTLQRVVRPGDDVATTWVRQRSLVEGSATV